MSYYFTGSYRKILGNPTPTIINPATITINNIFFDTSLISFTLMCWVNYNIADTSLTAGHFDYLVSQGNPYIGGKIGTARQISLIRDTDAIGIFYSNGSLSGFTYTRKANLNVWNHIAVSHISGGYLYVYLNGKTAYSIAGASNDAITGESTTMNASIGTHYSIDHSTNTYGNYGELSMCDVASWNIALTAEEINKIALSKEKGMPLQIKAKNLNYYFPLDDNNGLSNINNVYRYYTTSSATVSVITNDSHPATGISDPITYQ